MPSPEDITSAYLEREHAKANSLASPDQGDPWKDTDDRVRDRNMPALPHGPMRFVLDTLMVESGLRTKLLRPSMMDVLQVYKPKRGSLDKEYAP